MQKRLVFYVSIATILILSRMIHSHIDPSFDRREESGNCKLLSMDKYTVPEKFEQSSSYYHFSILSVCEFKPCRNGAKCHPLYESNGFLCKALYWIRLNKDEVCFGARDDSYGKFTIPSDGALFRLKLVYRSGYVTNNKNKEPFGSHWGLQAKQAMYTSH
ncbi:uncharacterized protein [Montipora foliosa]|uniref:uncharacterized protein n=1 Tax=Montipora foliosa TaxID=591990 RepID=UPI0035F18C7C